MRTGTSMALKVFSEGKEDMSDDGKEKGQGQA